MISPYYITSQEINNIGQDINNNEIESFLNQDFFFFGMSGKFWLVKSEMVSLSGPLDFHQDRDLICSKIVVCKDKSLPSHFSWIEGMKVSVNKD